MSVAELPQQGPERRGSAYDRTPPQDVAAEQSVLGGMLLSKDAIADVVEVVRGHDFYRPAHETVYDTVLDLYGRGEPADPVTVSAELQKRGELGRVGGAPYLHTLVATVPTAANAGYYAEIVRERAILRRLVEAGTRIAQLGYGADGDVDDVVDRAQAEVYSVTERRTSEDYRPLSEIMEGTLDEIEAIGSRDGQLVGVPTGFADLDEVTNGLHPGQMVIVAARPGVGKALALDTPLPTPAGWTSMAEVAVGDELLGADGHPTRVVAATEVLRGRPCYEVHFSDGAVIVADAEHQWRTTTRAARRAASERRPPSHFWSEEAIERVQRAAMEAHASPDDPAVTTAEALTEVGAEFRNVLLGTVVHRVTIRGRQLRRAQGSVREYHWHAPVYSRRDLLTALAAHISRPIGALLATVHEPVVTTEAMAATLRCASADQRLNHAVALAQPLRLPERSLPLSPYVLGVWLGDETSAAASFTSADPEVVAEVEAEVEAEGLRVVKTAAAYRYSMRLPAPPPVKPRSCLVCGAQFTPATSHMMTCGTSCGGRVRAGGRPPLVPATCPDCDGPSSGGRHRQACRARHGTGKGILRTRGMLSDKHIPTEYLRASEQQRRDLLAGLLDSDGTVSTNGTVVFAVTDARLARDTLELVLSLGYRATLRTKRVKGRTEARSTCYQVTFTPGDKVFRLPRKAARLNGSLRPSTTQRYVTEVRRVESVPVRCVQVDNDSHLYLAGRSMIPTHNSTLALDVARSASIRHGLTSVFFSLEMSRNEMAMRLLSAEARVSLQHMRTGHMTDEDWTRIARKTGEVSSAPMFIDDSPNMSMMEIRAKCRRLKQRHDLRLVVLDYMQLLSSGKRVESRQVEVSEFSRSLKLLAKELEVPVVALSQLNRGPEQRQDKKPLLSDLRESGCLTAETRLLRADTGAEVSLGELLASGARDVPVWSFDDRLRLVPRTLTHAFPSGVREVFRLRLASGREVTATANHPFLTYEGWTPLGQLEPGMRLGVARHVPAPLQQRRWDDDELTLLAHMLGDGSMLPGQPLRYASVDEANLAAVTAAAARRFGITAQRDDFPAARVITLRLPSPHRVTHRRRNPMVEWLDGLGVDGMRSSEKFVPAAVFSAPKAQVQHFLCHLWATDGSVSWDARNGLARVCYASTSRRLVDDIAGLLLRCNVFTRTKTVRHAGYRDGYHLYVDGAENQLRFLEEVGVHGARGERAAACVAHLRGIKAGTNLDTVPAQVWDRLREVLVDRQTTHPAYATASGTQLCGSSLFHSAPNRARMARVAAVLGSAELEVLATNDVFWDTVVAVEPVGERDVYDATVLGTHNFLADGIAAHNSLEQDADMVLLLHREDMYEKESPRAGEADLILAKHRNGPTTTVTVAFQGHYSRFVDMAPGG